MIVDKVNETTSFKKGKVLEKIQALTKKRHEASNDFKFQQNEVPTDKTIYLLP